MFLSFFDKILFLWSIYLQYKTKWTWMKSLMRKLAAVENLILCTLEWWLNQFFLPCDQWFYDGFKLFFHYLLLLERKFRWAFPCSFLFALHLEWSFNTTLDKIFKGSLYICELVFYFSFWFKFSSAWFYFLTKSTKEEEKS